MRLADFEGTWIFDRVIDDALSGQATATGTARIGQGAYLEETTLTLPDGTVLNGTRKYLWAEVEGGIEVRFHDGRPFHTIRFTAPADAHWCDPDTYNVTYDFDAYPKWTSTWAVKGPRKDYRMVTRYRKQAD
ncbi:MAG: DUF6314 family protein [Planktomarina sp.]